VLHITARHGTAAEEAITTLLTKQTVRDEERHSFESFTETLEVYWFWWEKDRRVGVISCFRRKET
jgi:hypothetical protein